jgi:hypothetical protein
MVSVSAVPSTHGAVVPAAAGVEQVVVGGETFTVSVPEVPLPFPPTPVAVKVIG